MGYTRRDLLRAAAALPLTSTLGSAWAQAKFPARPANLVVPYAPGGAADLLGRILAEKMRSSFGQTVIIENKGGAGGSIGAQSVARSAPDGYTALMHGSTMLVQQHLNPNAGYDFRTDFTPVTQLVQFPLVLLVNPSLPVKNVEEFFEYAKDKSNNLFYGSAGIGSSQHLVGELFNRSVGSDIQHVPYKGNGPATAALMTGDIQVMFDIVPSAITFGAAGKVRNLAVTSKTRNSSLPDLPTLDETILPGYEASFWHGLHLPKETDPAIVDYWYTATKKALDDKDIQKKLTEMGFDTIGSTPEQVAAYMEQDSKKWGEIIAQANISI
jgi:tripartite-type tricarboxylate transporter receptor subunit TctC